MTWIIAGETAHAQILVSKVQPVEREMRMSNTIALSLAFSIAFCGMGFAAQTTAPAKTPAGASATATATRVSIEADCQKFGGEVSALIDREKTSPNIASARSLFQRGIMDCMEGDQEAANSLYWQAKQLLDAGAAKTSASSVNR